MPCILVITDVKLLTVSGSVSPSLASLVSGVSGFSGVSNLRFANLWKVSKADSMMERRSKGCIKCAGE